VLPAGFVQGTRRDGSPNVSHAWARTVDGAQGGTWEACHLLGSAALDAYRGYTGQSRARATTAGRIDQLDAALPPDRAREWQDTRAQLPQILRARHDAERAWADSQASLDEASRRHWGRHARDAINAAQGRVAYNQQRLEEVRKAERDLRDHLAAIADYQQQRNQTITDSAPRRQELASSLAQLDAALDHARPQRLLALVSDPSPDLVKRLGEPPESAAGRAVWCHHALPIEAALDRNDGVTPPRTGWSQHDDRAAKRSKSPTNSCKSPRAASTPPSGPNSRSRQRRSGNRRSKT
jgi:hypothetical protein